MGRDECLIGRGGYQEGVRARIGSFLFLFFSLTKIAGICWRKRGQRCDNHRFQARAASIADRATQRKGDA